MYRNLFMLGVAAAFSVSLSGCGSIQSVKDTYNATPEYLKQQAASDLGVPVSSLSISDISTSGSRTTYFVTTAKHHKYVCAMMTGFNGAWATASSGDVTSESERLCHPAVE